MWLPPSFGRCRTALARTCAARGRRLSSGPPCGTDRRDAPADVGAPGPRQIWTRPAWSRRACPAAPGAFDVIVERHRRPVYQLCYRFVGNHEDASDLSQDVFLRAYRGLGNFRGGSSLATWLYRIGVNLCLNRVGRKDVADGDHRRPAAHRHPDRIGRRSRAARGAQRRRYAGRLPRCRRNSGRRSILRMYHELSHEEIAGMLGSSVGRRQGQLLSRARKPEEAAAATEGISTWRHLTSAEFVDLADGVRDDASAPHLAECDRCRRRARGSARDDGRCRRRLDVPEPSPLFWDHLSARVREAVAAGSPGRRVWRPSVAVRRLVDSRRGWRGGQLRS